MILCHDKLSQECGGIRGMIARRWRDANMTREQKAP